MSVSTLYPDSKPTFKVNFKKSKRLPSKFTFTRSSTASYVDRNGVLQTAAINKPRFDHDPITGECKGLLIEEARTNNLTWSEDVSQWLAATNLTVTTNQTTAPNGASTADQYLETSSTGLHVQDGSAFVFVTSTVYTYSVFVKSINGRNFEIGFPPTIFTNRFARFNLASGTVQGTDAGVTAGIQALANGWFRCWATSTCASGAGARVSNFVNDGSFARNYAGNTANGIFIWGAQLEAGAFPTSYIPTTSTTATRGIDQCTITGTNFSRWYNQIQGAWSIAYQGINNINVNTRRVIEVGVAGNTLNRHIVGYQNTTISRLLIVSEGASQVDNTQPATQGNLISVAYGYATNSVYHKVNLETGALDTVATIPNTTNALAIGFDFSSSTGTCLCGYIIKLIYWPQRITNTNIENLTRS